MIDTLLGNLAPHYCCGCGRIGSILCDSCKDDIVYEPFGLCAACVSRPVKTTGLCGHCRPPYRRAWVCGVHEGILDSAIDKFKFGPAREAAKPLVNVIASILPQLPGNSIFVPIPTITKHIRERGFGHMELLVRLLAKRCGRPYDASLLCRRTQTVQRGATAKDRQMQAKGAFCVIGEVNKDAVYILVDDVMTTGATLQYSARVLKEAGATEVWIVVLARQIFS